MKETVDSQIIEQLDPIARKYEEAVNNNDAAAVAALFTEDAVFVTDSGPFYGREAIEKFHVDLFKEWRFSHHLIKTDPNSPRIIGTAENIASNGEWSQTLQGQAGGPTQIKGYRSEIREGDDWKIRMLTINVAPPAAATPSPTTALAANLSARNLQRPENRVQYPGQ
jgi:ketosteroid isomerase-like protein